MPRMATWLWPGAEVLTVRPATLRASSGRSVAPELRIWLSVTGRDGERHVLQTALALLRCDDDLLNGVCVLLRSLCERCRR